MNIPTFNPPQSLRPKTVAGCRAERAEILEYMRYVSENLGPDDHKLEEAAQRMSELIYWEYWYVGRVLNPGDVQWHPFHDRATHEATVARMAAQ